MLQRFAKLVLMSAMLIAPSASFAAEGEARSKAGWPKPSRSVQSGEKLCRYKFSNNEHTVWVCKKEEPCCEWEALNNYVKCGSTITGCL
ncbi:MAG: hypothetical protein CTY31_13535 [Hyphomicrobium sp.]|jgi:hypothetical protein|nr:MAG: hypothetical protein CTY39_06435 [Hyphomicrobium sp.]PPC98421.1 MAG: hypothetical protein CTY31_13535 [Hyphomicrobium sp.]